MSEKDKKDKLSKEELRKKLTPLEYKITQECGTEPAFNNKYWDNKQPGIYVDVVSGEPLFSSKSKFESGTGWPSFTQPLHQDNIVEHTDLSLGMSRTEVKSRVADSHLGHVFNDGPTPTGLRYCINSAALKFVSVEHLLSEGYGDYLYLFPEYIEEEGWEIASFEAGCFWGTEAYFKKVPGVIDTVVGYAGGSKKNPAYEEVSSGKTGHVETTLIVFDPKKVSYETLLKHFWRIHNPTLINRQGNDRGTQYQAIIFYYSKEQKEEAEKSKKELAKSGKYFQPLATKIEKAGPFYMAEYYHQDYLDKNPGGYCHINLDLLKKPIE